MQKINTSHMPIVVSHHMLKSLVKGVEKMSKSIPDSTIFMEDSIKEVERKIKNAYCLKRKLMIILYLIILNI